MKRELFKHNTVILPIASTNDDRYLLYPRDAIQNGICRNKMSVYNDPVLRQNGYKYHRNSFTTSQRIFINSGDNCPCALYSIR